MLQRASYEAFEFCVFVLLCNHLLTESLTRHSNEITALYRSFAIFSLAQIVTFPDSTLLNGCRRSMIVDTTKFCFVFCYCVLTQHFYSAVRESTVYFVYGYRCGHMLPFQNISTKLVRKEPSHLSMTCSICYTAFMLNQCCTLYKAITVAFNGGLSSVVAVDFLSKNHKITCAFFLSELSRTEEHRFAAEFCNDRNLPLFIGSF